MKEQSADFPFHTYKTERKTVFSKIIRRLSALLVLAYILQVLYIYTAPETVTATPQLTNTQRFSLITKCNSIRSTAGPPSSFSPSDRIKSGNDRWVPGTPSVLLKNAKIWTGAGNGTEIVFGDVLLDNGLVIAVGYVPPSLAERHARKDRMMILDVGGKWVTPGLVDLHSHIGVNSAPGLRGASDGNSRKAPILPWLRSIDGLNTHDESYTLAVAGGVTVAQVLPGSANNIGGQSFVIKLRPTSERSTTSRIIEPPWTLTHNNTDLEEGAYTRWRHMKHACGENPDRVYGQTRMDGQWNFRRAYNEARKIRDKQDALCAKIDARDWASIQTEEEFPEDLQWESLVDVLRGRVKLSIHCYEAVDLDGIVRLSNEFKFPIASFHHAGETYLVPDLLKKTWGGAPSIALFASNFRKKREAYRGSEFAPRVLAEHGIPVVMKSDHPVMNSRYLLYEAQQAFYYGLSPSLALASVTSVPAKAAGLNHRIGTVAEGYDADLVIWDSHPLTLGATPEQVFIDGIAQLSEPIIVKKSSALQGLPKVPNWDKEKNETVKWEGLPPLQGRKTRERVKLVNVRSIMRRMVVDGTVGDDNDDANIDANVAEVSFREGTTVIIEGGKIICIQEFNSARCQLRRRQGPATTYTVEEDEDGTTVIDLRGGSIAPGLTTFGSPLGLVEIRLEASTNDGEVIDPLVDRDLPSILGTKDGVVKAVDGLALQGRNTLLAYRSGVTTSVTAPVGFGFLQGISTAFNVGASHALEGRAIIQPETALHVTLSYNLPVSVSTQIAVLRTALFGEDDDDGFIRHFGSSFGSSAWERVRQGDIPLVISVESADIMSTLLRLKAKYEHKTSRRLKFTFSGATEAHIVADQIAKAGVSVIVTSPRPYPRTWEKKRILPGPPLSGDSIITKLLHAGVHVAIGVVDEYAARNTRFDLAWIALESNGRISKTQALALATTNLRKALGLSPSGSATPDVVLYGGGGVLDFESKPVGILSAARGLVEIF